MIYLVDDKYDVIEEMPTFSNVVLLTHFILYRSLVLSGRFFIHHILVIEFITNCAFAQLYSIFTLKTSHSYNAFLISELYNFIKSKV